MPRPALAALAALVAAAVTLDAAPTTQPAAPLAKPAAPAAGWRDMLRAYLELRDARSDLSARFPGMDADMARLGAAFAATAYPENPDLGRKNFLRLVRRLRLEHPDKSRRLAFFTPNKTPWPGYSGPVDSDGLAHFLFNTGTLPMSLFDHPLVPVIRRHDVDRDRVKPVSQCAARVLRRELADMAAVERDASVREALVRKVRRAFDTENPGSPMSDEEARCLSACLPYMA